MFGLGNGGVVWAELWVPSGLAAVVIATTPFWMVGVETMLQGGERFTRRHIVGLLLGFGGILLLVGPGLFGGSEGLRLLGGVIALQVACAGWAAGSAYGKRLGMTVTPGMSAAMQMWWGGLIMLVAGTSIGEWRAFHVTTTTGTAVAYLTLAGSIAGFGAYVYALAYLPVSIVSLYAYVNPVIAVALGTLLLGEPFGLRMAIAVVIILSGLAIVSMSRSAAEAGWNALGRSAYWTRWKSQMKLEGSG
jgi:drug/metabolite transporter (DMT)-like permease